MVSVSDAPLKPVSLAYTKGKFRFACIMEMFLNVIFSVVQRRLPRDSDSLILLSPL